MSDDVLVPGHGTDPRVTVGPDQRPLAVKRLVGDVSQAGTTVAAGVHGPTVLPGLPDDICVGCRGTGRAETVHFPEWPAEQHDCGYCRGGTYSGHPVQPPMCLPCVSGNQSRCELHAKDDSGATS